METVTYNHLTMVGVGVKFLIAHTNIYEKLWKLNKDPRSIYENTLKNRLVPVHIPNLKMCKDYMSLPENTLLLKASVDQLKILKSYMLAGGDIEDIFNMIPGVFKVGLD